MRERVRAVALLIRVSFRTDPWRSIGVLVEPLGMLSTPLFALFLKLITDGVLAQDVLSWPSRSPVSAPLMRSGFSPAGPDRGCASGSWNRSDSPSTRRSPHSPRPCLAWNITRSPNTKIGSNSCAGARDSSG